MQAKYAPSRALGNNAHSGVLATINSSLAEKISKSSSNKSTDDISNVQRKTKAATDANERAGSISSRLRS